MTETAQMRTWAEISLDRLAHNYQTLRAMLAPDCRFLGLRSWEKSRPCGW